MTKSVPKAVCSVPKAACKFPGEPATEMFITFQEQARESRSLGVIRVGGPPLMVSWLATD